MEDIAIDFQGIAIGLAAISISLAGLMMVMMPFFPELAEQAKRTWLQSVLGGLILVSIAGFVVGLFGPG